MAEVQAQSKSGVSRDAPPIVDDLSDPVSVPIAGDDRSLPQIGRTSAFAVFKLITSSYLVGRITGRSAGFDVGVFSKEEKPVELPLFQPTKFELVVNLSIR